MMQGAAERNKKEADEFLNHWIIIGNLCLQKAEELLKKEATPTAETVEVVCKLLNTAYRMASAEDLPQ